MARRLFTISVGSFLYVYAYCAVIELKGCTEPDWFLCADRKECVSFSFKCDGMNDCPDNSDEMECGDHEAPSVSVVPCQHDQHTCKDGSCIPIDKFCDRVNDCPDGSDEYDRCTEHKICEAFRCKDGYCIRKEWVCDGSADCNDGSDELNCSNQTVPTDHCNQQIDRYLCRNKKCIPLELVCDRENDCGDESDEDADGCALAAKMCTNVTRCDHVCRRTPKGPSCTCRPGFKLLDHRICKDIDECEHYDTCDQTCINTPGSYSCACHPDYILQDDSKSCKADGGEALMVFSEKTQIRGFLLESKIYYSIISNLSHATAVSLDANYVHWSDIRHGEEVIARQFTDNLNMEPEVIVTAGLSAPADIAIDWITDNVYFTDEDYAHIGVCTAIGSFCRVLIQDHTPKALALVPLSGVMYWSDWGSTPHIATASMDGRNVTPFITENVGWAISLTIDYPADRLYWIDSKQKIIETVRLDGRDRKTILREIAKHPFSLAIFESQLYWSDWDTNTVQSCNKYTGKDWHILLRGKFTIYGIHVYHSVLKPKVANPCNSNPCSQLCLLNSNKKFTCACTADSELSTDRRTCKAIKKRQHLIIASANKFINYYHNLLGKPKISSTSANHHITALAYDSLTDTVLANDQQTNTVLRYDTKTEETKKLVSTENESLGGMDFDYIGNNLYYSDTAHKTVAIYSLSTGQTMFLYFQEEPHDLVLAPEEGYIFLVVRVKDSYRIDKIPMSGGGPRSRLVEGVLKGPKIALSYDRELKRIFWVDQGRSRIESIRIDGHDKRLFRTGLFEPMALTVLENQVFWTERGSNYLHWADKDNAHKRDKRISLSIPDNSETLQLTSIGHIDKTDDEHGCRVKNGNCSHVCLVSVSPTERICGCPPATVLSADNVTCTKLTECRDDEIECDGRQHCIKQHQRCDGTVDCPNGDDEIRHCNITGNCQKTQFTCTNGECVDSQKRCDYHDDCTDRSDEKDCERKVCEQGEFQCREGECISMYLVCNDKDDCVDSSDEMNCKDRTCSSDDFLCDRGHCIPKSWMCDGEADCDDKSDETDSCFVKKCDAEMFTCKNGRCVDATLVCDMVDNCGDGSDEHNCATVNNRNMIRCKENQYRCHGTTTCLDKHVRCNGIEDCPQRDDERNCPQCKPKIEFTCDNRKCIPRIWMCDAHDDCGDMSDERDCTSGETAATHVSVVQADCEEYRCSSGRCLSFDRVCDTVTDCSDGSDELGNCTSSCLQDNPCEFGCHKTPRGPVCDCPTGYRLDADATSCSDINECDDKTNICSHICRNTKGSFVCSCYDGFVLRSDQVSCKAAGPPMEIIAAVRADIRRMPPSLSSIDVILQESFDDITGLDVNANTRTVYWSNAASGIIGQIILESKQRNVTTAVRRPEVLALDWITDNIYVYDADRPHSIKVCNLNLQKCAMIIDIPEAKKVTSVAVNPQHGLLFWCQASWRSFRDRMSSEIYRSSMVGSNKKAIVIKDLGIVNGITIDDHQSLLYWSDTHLNVIQSSDFNGNNRQTFLQSEDTHQPTGINIYEDSIYWLAGSRGQMLKCKLHGDKHCTTIDLGRSNVDKYFTILHVSRQPLVVNSCRDRVCDYMCALKENDYACICENGYGQQSKAICGGDSGSKIKRNRQVTEAIIGMSVAVLILFGCLYYRRLKLAQPSKDSDTWVRFQNPSFDRREEVLSSLCANNLAYPSVVPGEHEYVNPTMNIPRTTRQKSFDANAILLENDEEEIKQNTHILK